MQNKIFFALLYFLVLFDFLIFNIDIGLINITLLRILIFGLVFYYTLSYLARKKLMMSKEVKSVLMFFIIWLIYMMMSLLWVINTNNVYNGIYYLVIFILFIYLIVMILNTSRNLIFMENIIYIFIVFITALGFFEYATGIRFKISRYNLAEFVSILEKFNTNAVTGMFGNENDYSLFLALSFPVLLIGLISRNATKKALSIITMFGIIFLVVVNDAKIILLMIALQIIVFLILINISRFKKIMLVFLILIGSFTFIIIDSDILGSFANISQQLKLEAGSSFIRLNLMKNVSYILSETSYLGAGVANYGYYLNPLLNFQGIVNPHNWWGELISEHGIIISVLYIYLYIWIMLQLYRIFKVNVDRTRYTALAIFISLFGLIIGSMSPSSLFYYWPMWLYIGLALAVINVEKLKKILR